MEYIACPICESENYSIVYECFQETGQFLGRIKTTFVICRDCGFMYMNPRFSRDVLKKYYQSSIHASGRVYHDTTKNSSHVVRNKNRVHFFAGFITHDKGKILEIGCSKGEFIDMLQLERWEKYGVEPSPISANEAKSKGIIVREGFIEDITFEKGSFDIICFFGLLEHIYDINNFMNIIDSIIKPGGLLWIEVPDSLKPVAQIAEYFSFEHLSHFIKATLCNFLYKHGFGNVVFDNTVTDSRIRVCAQKIDDKNLKQIRSDSAYSELMESIEHYKINKNLLENGILQRFSLLTERWHKERTRLAIYGAGVHTLFLLNLLDLSDLVVAIIDSDPKKIGTPFLGWNISSVAILEKGEIDAVIISSRAFQDEIYNKISKHNNLEIVKCYK